MSRRLVAAVLARALALAALAGLALAVAWPALAQAPANAATTAIAVGGLWVTLQPLVATALAAVVGAALTWATARFSALTHVTLEDKYRDSLHDAAVTGVNIALSRIGASLGSLTLDARSSLVAEAANWVVRSVPDALAYLGVTPDKLAALIESKLAGSGSAPAAAGDQGRAGRPSAIRS